MRLGRISPSSSQTATPKDGQADMRQRNDDAAHRPACGLLYTIMRHSRGLSHPEAAGKVQLALAESQSMPLDAA